MSQSSFRSGSPGGFGGARPSAGPGAPTMRGRIISTVVALLAVGFGLWWFLHAADEFARISVYGGASFEHAMDHAMPVMLPALLVGLGALLFGFNRTGTVVVGGLLTAAAAVALVLLFVDFAAFGQGSPPQGGLYWQLIGIKPQSIALITTVASGAFMLTALVFLIGGGRASSGGESVGRASLASTPTANVSPTSGSSAGTPYRGSDAPIAALSIAAFVALVAGTGLTLFGGGGLITAIYQQMREPQPLDLVMLFGGMLVFAFGLVLLRRSTGAALLAGLVLLFSPALTLLGSDLLREAPSVQLVLQGGAGALVGGALVGLGIGGGVRRSSRSARRAQQSAQRAAAAADGSTSTGVRNPAQVGAFDDEAVVTEASPFDASRSNAAAPYVPRGSGAPRTSGQRSPSTSGQHRASTGHQGPMLNGKPYNPNDTGFKR